jgi:hypothetical protein
MKRWERIAATTIVAVAAAGVVTPALAIPPQYHGEWCAVPRTNEGNGEYTWGLCSQLKPEAAAQGVKLTISENSVKIGGTAAPWVYEIKDEGHRTRGPDDYWHIDMRGEKELLTLALYRTNAKSARNDGTVKEMPVLITENGASENEQNAIPVLFGLGWAKQAADETLRLDAEAKRMYPGLQGEELEEKKRDLRVNRAMEDALFGNDAPALRGRADELRDRIMGGY